MKNMLFAGLFTLASLNLSAQRGGHPHHQRHHSEAEQRPSTEERAILQSKQMALHLDLSEKQQKEVQALLINHHAATEVQHQSWKKDSTETKDGKHRFNQMNAHLDAQLAFNRELKTILGDEKFETWRQFHKPRGPQRNWHGPERLHQKPRRQERHGKQ